MSTYNEMLQQQMEQERQQQQLQRHLQRESDQFDHLDNNYPDMSIYIHW